MFLASPASGFRELTGQTPAHERLIAEERADRATEDAFAICGRAAEAVGKLGREIDALHASTSWRVTQPLRIGSLLVRRVVHAAARFGGVLRRSVRGWVRWRPESPEPDPSGRTSDARPDDEAAYRLWTERFDTLREHDRRAIGRHIVGGRLPSIVVLVAFDPSCAAQPEEAIGRLRGQLLSDWRGVLHVDSNAAPLTVARIRAAAHHDDRLTVVAGSPAAAAAALGRHGRADYLLLMRGDVLLREHALYCFAAAAGENPRARLIYADEDRLGADGRRCQPKFKPGFSPALIGQAPSLGPCILVRREAVGAAALAAHLAGPEHLEGGFAGFARHLQRTETIRIPFVLYHDVLVSSSPRLARPDLVPGDFDCPSATIIIPTRDRVDLLAPCIESIETVTDGPGDRREIIVVDNASADPATLAFLAAAEAEGRVRVLRDPRPFNFSRLNNLAARQATSELLVFLNNDTRVLRPDWLRRLAAYAMQPDVAVVGAKLLYPDDTVQHGGLVLGIQGIAGHAHVGLGKDEGGYCDLANLTHEVSAVTGACHAIRRSVFDRIGGFDEAAAVTCNDALLCVQAMEAGFRNIYVADPLVVHLESKTRGLCDTSEIQARTCREVTYARARYPALFKEDPYYNPNLSLERAYELAAPPRVEPPWHVFARRSGAPLRVLILSITHEIGHPVTTLLRRQAEHLAGSGVEVFIGGPPGRNEPRYDGCRRIYLDGNSDVAQFAFARRVDCVVAHTMPFFSVVRRFGPWPRSIIVDHGEAGSGDALEKALCCSIADRVCGAAGDAPLALFTESVLALCGETARA